MPENLTFHRSDSYGDAGLVQHLLKIKVLRRLEDDSDSDNEGLDALLDEFNASAAAASDKDDGDGNQVDKQDDKVDFPPALQIIDSQKSNRTSAGQATSSQSQMENSEEGCNGEDFNTGTDSEIDGKLGKKILKRISNLEQQMKNQTDMILNLTRLIESS